MGTLYRTTLHGLTGVDTCCCLLMQAMRSAGQH